MKKKVSIPVFIFISIILVFGIVIFFYGITNKNYLKGYEPGEKAVYVGERSLDEYYIKASFKTKEAAKELNKYIYTVHGRVLRFRKSETGNYPITITVSEETRGIFIEDGMITIAGSDSEDCLELVHIFVNRFLGYAFAGQEREFRTSEEDIYITDNVYQNNDPWIPEREPIICLWKSDTPRGRYHYENVAPYSDILNFSDEQLYSYVNMMCYMGFTGIQVTDMCASWAQFGGYERVHERLRFMADAAHSLGMKFTLWVWGAEFTGYGWYDESVVYYDYYHYALSQESPEAVATFRKYYSIYAELADCSDRVIMHFWDPTNLRDVVDVSFYAKMFRDMVREKNPDIIFGVSDYTNRYDKEVFKQELGDDFFVLSGTVTNASASWQEFRDTCRANNIDYGVWSWNLCENEIDQYAMLSVNADLIKNVYNLTADDGDAIWKPDYWSEMDSYHNANIFSLYCAAHLLQDRDLDTDELLFEIADDVVGEKYRDAMFEILKLIQTARTGSSWSTFKFMHSDDYLLTSDEYPYEEILEKSERLMPVLEEMIGADIKTNKIPLSITVSEMLSIYRTHLKQITEFAEFRKNLADLYVKYENGAGSEELELTLKEIYKAVPNYDAVLGVWGQPEALAQLKLVESFCETAGIPMVWDENYFELLKDYIYGEIVAYDKESGNENYVYSVSDNLWRLVIGEQKTMEIINDLIREGKLEEVSYGVVKLPD